MFTLITLLAGQAFAADPTVDTERLIRALDLPVAAERIRRLGASNDEVRDVLRTAKDNELPASETAEALETAGDAAEEHGTTENFGAFVGARLDEGLRGQELAAAIRAEHEANGRGRGHGRGGGPDGARGGRPDHPRGGDHGSEDSSSEDSTSEDSASEDSGEEEVRGRPDATGRDTERPTATERPAPTDRPETKDRTKGPGERAPSGRGTKGGMERPNRR